MPRTTATQARAEIIAAAAALFAEHGYEATSLQEIADALGGSKAAVLYHFHSKAMILRELMEPAAADLADVVARAERLRGTERRRAGVVGFVDAVIRFRDELASYPAAIRRVTEMPECADLGLAPLGERLIAVLTGGSGDVVERAAAVTAVNGVLATAQSLDEQDPQVLRGALTAVALRTLGLPAAGVDNTADERVADRQSPQPDLR